MHLGSSVGDDGISEKSVEVRVLLDGKVDASWDDSALLHLLGGVAGELEDLSGEVLEDGSEVDGGTVTDSLGESSFLEESGDSSDREVESGSLGSGHLFGASGFSFSFSFGSWHV